MHYYSYSDWLVATLQTENDFRHQKLNETQNLQGVQVWGLN